MRKRLFLLDFFQDTFYKIKTCRFYYKHKLLELFDEQFNKSNNSEQRYFLLLGINGDSSQHPTNLCR